MQKRGQIKLSFSVIFSIFLIVIFIAFAIKVIWGFVAVGECVAVADFYDDFQSSIDKARTSQETNQPYNLKLGSTVDKICFADLNSSQRGPHKMPDSYSPGDNFFIIFNEEGCAQLDKNKIEGIDLELLTETNNPNCFENSNQVTIKKSLYSRLVTIE